MASKEKETEADEMTALIGRLEESINNYKEEYAQLISQAEAIKSDLKQVQEKVDRSMSLLKSLGIEKDRWVLVVGGIFYPKKHPNISPKTGPKCHLKRMHASTSHFEFFWLHFWPFCYYCSSSVPNSIGQK